MKFLLIALAAVAILAGGVIGCSVWVFKSSFELHPVGTTATFKESADCLVRYGNNFKGWRLDNDRVQSCFPTQTAAKQKTLIACFNTYEHSHLDHKGWPEDDMRGCKWSGLTAVPAPRVVRLTLGEVVAVPAAPRAGKHFLLKVGVTRTDSATKDTGVSDPQMDFSVTIDGEDVNPYRAEFYLGKIRVSLTVPESAEGKRLRIKMTIADDSPAATKVVTFPVVP